MLTLQISAIRPIPVGSDCFTKYCGIACEGKHFYLTVTKCCQIHRFDLDFNHKECYDVCREYASICYDKHAQCFWATAAKECNRLYKLDSCMNEVDSIFIRSCDNNPIMITGVSCAKKCNKLLISSNTGIAEIDKSNNAVPCFLQKCIPHCRFTSVQMLENCYVSSACCNMEQSISIFSDCNELLLQCHLTDEYRIEDMTQTCCECSKTTAIYFLATKCGCYSYLMKGIIRCHTCCDEPHKDTMPVKEIAQCMMQQLFNGESCNRKDDCCEDRDCCHRKGCGAKTDCCEAQDCHCGKHECQHRNDCGQTEGGHCHKCECKSCCGCENDDSCCKLCVNSCLRPGDCAKNCNDIIESIALVEAAISHILNAEGEKIQKILCASDSPCDILRVNEAVNKTIINITQLEHVLYSKLQLTKELYPEKEKGLLSISSCCTNHCEQEHSPCLHERISFPPSSHQDGCGCNPCSEPCK